MHLELLWPSMLTIGGVLAGGGTAIGIVEGVRARPLRASMLMYRWLTWVVIGSLWVFAILWPIALAVLLVAFSVVAAFEYARLRRVPILDRLVLLPAALLAVPLVAIGAVSVVGLVASSWRPCPRSSPRTSNVARRASATSRWGLSSSCCRCC